MTEEDIHTACFSSSSTVCHALAEIFKIPAGFSQIFHRGVMGLDKFKYRAFRKREKKTENISSPY